MNKAFRILSLLAASAVSADALQVTPERHGVSLLAEKETKSMFDFQAFQDAVQKLNDLGVVTDQEYWLNAIRPGQFIDSAPLVELLIAVANRFEKVETIESAMDVLGRNKVVPNYQKWAAELSSKRKIAAGVAGVLIISVAKNLN